MSDEDPIKILQVRLAKGEINSQQYQEILSFLLRDISSFQQNDSETVIAEIRAGCTGEDTEIASDQSDEPLPEEADDLLDNDANAEKTPVKTVANEVAKAYRDEQPGSGAEIDSGGEVLYISEDVLAFGVVPLTPIPEEEIEKIKLEDGIRLHETTKVEHVEMPDHMLDWLQCLRTRKTPNASMDAGYQHAVAVVMAMMAFDSGRRMVFDPEKREVREG